LVADDAEFITDRIRGWATCFTCGFRTSHQRPHPSTRASRPHRGVPSLEFFFTYPLTVPSRVEKLLGGQPPRHNVPVHLSTPRGRPPVRHRRGRSHSNHPRATAPMVRRSGASGPEATQKAGAPGRHGHDHLQRTGSANSTSDQRQQAASTISHQRPYPSTRASRPHRGVPSLEFFFTCPLTVPSRVEKLLGGQPPRHNVPVHLTTPRDRPPVRHRRGRSHSNRLRATAPMVRRSGASRREATQKAGAPGRHGHDHRRMISFNYGGEADCALAHTSLDTWDGFVVGTRWH